MQTSIKINGGPAVETTTKEEIITLRPKPTNSFGRWKPTIYWHTPILMVLAAAVLMGGLTVLIRKLARRFERERWTDDVRDQSYEARPLSPVGEESPVEDSSEAGSN